MAAGVQVAPRLPPRWPCWAPCSPPAASARCSRYSNPLAAAGGYVGAHVLFPAMELGAAYDEAMKTQVWGPLGMTSTTFDFGRALGGNHATSHGLSIDAHAGSGGDGRELLHYARCGPLAAHGAACGTC